MHTATPPAMPSTSGIPEIGEEVAVKTLFEKDLLVDIHAVIDGSSLCQGTAKHEVYEGAVGDMKLIIEHGEQIEFSCSKILGIDRD